MNKLTLGRLFGLAVTTLALNTYVIGRLILPHSEIAANTVFILVRVGTLLGFSFALAYWLGRGRWEIVRLGALLEFLDRGIFGGSLILNDYFTNKAAWLGASVVQPLFVIGWSFMIISPVFIILCLLGSVAGQDLAARRIRLASASKH